MALLSACEERRESEDSGTDAGSISTDGGRPAIPPPRFVSCAALEPIYAGGECDGCAPVLCPCEDRVSTYAACHEGRGCLTAVNCDVACERDAANVERCGSTYAPCKLDVDCNSGRCLRSGTADGDCSTGENGAPCLEAADCLSATCAAVNLEGDRRCTSGSGGDYCNAPDDCGSGLACPLPSASFVGICSDGSLFSKCNERDDCETHVCVYDSDPSTTLGTCRDGSLGRSCISEQECASGICSTIASSSDGERHCTDGSAGNACWASFDCAEGLFCVNRNGQCSSGGVGEGCNDNEDCRFGACAMGPKVSVCTEGQLGQACSENVQCLSKHCFLPGSAAPIGVCTDGEVGTQCDDGDDSDCDGGRCALVDLGVGSGSVCTAGRFGDFCSQPHHCIEDECTGTQNFGGYCSDGAVGSPCVRRDDCESNRCDVRAVPNVCVDGLERERCTSHRECGSGVCALPPNGAFGQCTSGAVSSPCGHDADCATMVCVAPPSGSLGLCSEGLRGNECFDDGDCKNGTCAFSTDLDTGECADSEIDSDAGL
jgi:hypothetical protein